MIDLSYIVPIYETPIELLKRCLCSLCSMNRLAVEIICVVDSPGDLCESVVNDIAKDDSRIIVLVNDKNRGVSYSRNRGLDVARGEYVSFVDADDEIIPKTYEKTVQICRSHCLYVCAMQATRSSDVFMSRYSEKLVRDRIRVIETMRMSSVAAIYNHKMLQMMGVRFLDGIAYNEDFAFITKILCSGRDKVAVLDSLAYKIIGHPQSVSRRPLRTKRVFDGIKVAESVLEDIRSANLSPNEIVWYLNLLFREEFFPGARFEIASVLSATEKKQFSERVAKQLALIADVYRERLTLVARFLFNIFRRYPFCYFGCYGICFYVFKVLQKIGWVTK